MVYPVSMATREQVWTITITKSNGYWLRTYCVLCLCSSFTQPESVKSSGKSIALKTFLRLGICSVGNYLSMRHRALGSVPSISSNWAWWHRSTIPALQKSRGGGRRIKSSESLFLIGREFQDSLSHRRFCFKIKVRQNEDSRPAPNNSNPFPPLSPPQNRVWGSIHSETLGSEHEILKAK